MHAAQPDSLVLWYDSLTTQGKIQWQDRLSPLNKSFFDVTDGIFTNYTWKKHGPHQSTLLGGNRCRDIYTGIDVWGRNTFGGGGFNVHKALREIVSSGTSVALFAPAWTFEFFDSQNFQQIQDRFWNDKNIVLHHSVKKELGTVGLDPLDLGCVSDWIQPSFVSVKDGFHSFFDCGLGQSYFMDGKRVSDKAWSHLSRQSCLLWMSSEDNLYGKYVHVDSFHGGSCLEIQSDKNFKEWQSFCLSLADFPNSSPILIQVTLKPMVADVSLKCFSMDKEGRKREKDQKEMLTFQEWNHLEFQFDSSQGIDKIGFSIKTSHDSLTSHLSSRQTLLRMGQIRVSFNGMSSKNVVKSKQDGIVSDVIQTGHNLSYTLQWKENKDIEKWELFRVNDWIGTAFNPIYRDCISLETLQRKETGMILHGYNRCGKLSVQLVLEFQLPTL